MIKFIEERTRPEKRDVSDMDEAEISPYRLGVVLLDFLQLVHLDWVGIRNIWNQCRTMLDATVHKHQVGSQEIHNF